MSHPVENKSWRLWILLAALAVTAAVPVAQGLVSVDGLSRLPLFDFVEYWAAGRLNAAGENPYDPEGIDEIGRAHV